MRRYDALTAKVQRERRDAILALLEERPYTLSELAGLLKIGNGALSMCCRALRRRGVIVQLADWRWTLPGNGATTAIGLAPPRKRGRPIGTGGRRPLYDPTPVAKPAAASSVHTVGQTRVVDGVEYEVTFDGRGETPEWPVRGGSSINDELNEILRP